jgi:hypothetical protein
MLKKKWIWYRIEVKKNYLDWVKWWGGRERERNNTWKRKRKRSFSSSHFLQLCLMMHAGRKE